ncbi:MAG: HD domain-containing protein [Ktedonobacteraceae bacterium]
METTQAEAEVVASIYAEVERRFNGVDDLAHGWEHVYRVYQQALYIAAQEGADRSIVALAALMHDLGRSVPTAIGQHHADISAALATELLSAYQVPQDKQEAILHAILAHSFSRGIEPLTLEARVVRDADRLEGLGAIGILRWAITGTLRRTPQTRSYHPADPFAEQHELDDSHYMLDHFYSKLLKLSDTMATATGRALAQRRTAFMHSYLNEMRDELQIEPDTGR